MTSRNSGTMPKLICRAWRCVKCSTRISSLAIPRPWITVSLLLSMVLAANNLLTWAARRERRVKGHLLAAKGQWGPDLDVRRVIVKAGTICSKSTNMGNCMYGIAQSFDPGTARFLAQQGLEARRIHGTDQVSQTMGSRVARRLRVEDGPH